MDEVRSFHILGPSVVDRATLKEMTDDALLEHGCFDKVAIARNHEVVDLVFTLSGNTDKIHMLEYQAHIEDARLIVDARHEGQIH